MALVRITPLFHQYPLNDKLYYPVYTACAELGLPVSINVGIPGPRVRSACQHPSLLEDVLIDFKGVTVIGAHMGHPYEALLMQYMLKWPDLYLSTSAYLAKYMDPALVSFMDSSRRHGPGSSRRTIPSSRWSGPWPPPGSAAVRRGGPSLSRRHGRPSAPPRLTRGPGSSSRAKRKAARVRCRAWTSVASACGGAARGGTPSTPGAASPLSSSPSATGRCGHQAGSTRASRRTSRSCWPPGPHAGGERHRQHLGRRT